MQKNTQTGLLLCDSHKAELKNRKHKCIQTRADTYKKEQLGYWKFSNPKQLNEFLNLSFCKDPGKFISRTPTASYRRITLSGQQVV